MRSSKMFKRIISLLLTTEILLSFTMPAFAEEHKILKKTESVYVNTDYYGTVTKMNIYNDYEIANVDRIIDHGEYSKIQVITGDNKPIVSGDEILWNTSGDRRLGYISTIENLELKKKLPWNVELNYYLNGVETLAEELPHKSGLVKVVIKVVPNKEAPEVYQNNYMMEVKASFDMSKYLSVSSEEAIEAQVGNTKSLTFIVLPGREKELSLEIGTDDFSMGGITFAMVPLEGDILELVQDVAKDKDDLRTALDAMNDSLEVILNQVNSSTKNLDKISKASKDVNQGLDGVNKNNASRIETIEELKTELNGLGDDSYLFDENIESIIKDVDELEKRLSEVRLLEEKLNKSLKGVSEKLSKNEEDLERIKKRSKNLKSDLETMQGLIENTKKAVGGLSNVLDGLDASSLVDTDSLSKNLYQIKNSTEAMAKEAAVRMQTGGEDQEFYMDVIGTAQKIGTSLQEVSKNLSDTQSAIDDTSKKASSLSSSLSKLQVSLTDTAEVVEGLSTYSKDVPDTIDNINNTVKAINDTINIITNEADDNLDKDYERIIEQLENLQSVLKNIKQLKITLGEIQDTSIKALDVLEDDLNEASSTLHQGATSTIDGTQDLLVNLKGMASQGSTLKNAKNQVYNIITNDMDDLDNKTNIFKIDSDEPIVSFASEKNETPKKVQIFIQTESIKEVVENKNVDLEKEKEEMSFGDKLISIFQKILAFFGIGKEAE